MALRGAVIVLVLYGGLLWLTQWGFQSLPKGYVPSQDMGYLLMSVQLPDAASVERTKRVVKQIEKIVIAEPSVASRLSLAGMSFTLGVISPNAGQFFIILKNFDDRRNPHEYYTAIQKRLEKRIAAEVPDARILMFGPPPLHGLGNASGFKIMVEDRGDLGLEKLQDYTDALVAAARKSPVLTRVFTSFTVKYPQMDVKVNKDQVHTMRLNLSDIYATLQTYLGSRYVNDFNLFGRTWQVIVQADARFRNTVEDVRRLKVRNAAGRMAPLGSVADIKVTNGPLVVPRYNLYPAASVQGGWPAGTSSGQAITAFQALARQVLPKQMAVEWTEITYLQTRARDTGMLIFGLAVVLVFLVLAAQYESWSLPLAIILVVPMCILCAITGVWLTRFWGPASDINIFTQIGFVVLVGLASKNAVLIVEFAKHKLDSGLTVREAALEACRLRLRPILMTSFAFILGVTPLVVAEGAGMEMRRALGIAVFSGMLGVTLFGIFLTPVFFVVIEWVGNSRVFASQTAHRVGAVLLGVFALGYVRVLVRRPWQRKKLAAKPADALERELADVDRIFVEHVHPEPPVVNGEGHPGGEKMVVVDHQRGKTDITVIQPTVVAEPENGNGASEILTEKNGSSPRPPKDK